MGMDQADREQAKARCDAHLVSISYRPRLPRRRTAPSASALHLASLVIDEEKRDHAARLARCRADGDAYWTSVYEAEIEQLHQVGCWLRHHADRQRGK